jgi:hypothetical protein
VEVNGRGVRGLGIEDVAEVLLASGSSVHMVLLHRKPEPSPPPSPPSSDGEPPAPALGMHAGADMPAETFTAPSVRATRRRPSKQGGEAGEEDRRRRFRSQRGLQQEDRRPSYGRMNTTTGSVELHDSAPSAAWDEDVLPPPAPAGAGEAGASPTAEPHQPTHQPQRRSGSGSDGGSWAGTEIPPPAMPAPAPVATDQQSERERERGERESQWGEQRGGERGGTRERERPTFVRTDAGDSSGGQGQRSRRRSPGSGGSFDGLGGFDGPGGLGGCGGLGGFQPPPDQAAGAQGGDAHTSGIWQGFGGAAPAPHSGTASRRASLDSVREEDTPPDTPLPWAEHHGLCGNEEFEEDRVTL